MLSKSFRSTFQKPNFGCLTRFYCQDRYKPALKSSIQKAQEDKSYEADDLEPYRSRIFVEPRMKYWNEKGAIRKEKKLNRFPHNVHCAADFLKFLQSFNSFPKNLTEMFFLLKRRKEQKDLISQKYLPRRVAVLKEDLAAAHFLIQRGGSVKFKGNPEWTGVREKKLILPMCYTPGMLVEGIKAEKTSLRLEGLQNLSNLFHLTYLSLKDLDTIDDWCLDFISQEHYINLKHLDISGCKNVTYRGLSCFYRFERLEVLEVGGIPETTEFKLACLMLLDIMPFLDIKGIDLSLPDEIKPANIEESEKLKVKAEAV